MKNNFNEYWKSFPEKDISKMDWLPQSIAERGLQLGREELGFFTLLPIKIVKDKNLLPNSKLLYSILTGLVREKGYCWAKNEFLAECLGIKERQLGNLLIQLIKNKYISIDPGRSNKGTYRKIYLTICK
jgi:hypothetical protein